MKKIIPAIITAAISVTSICAPAQAASRTLTINTALENMDEIHILYNDKVVQYEDVKPINTDGRVMIPFRAALENMGAKVDYSDPERLVTAAKGDTTISFTLLDDTIYINKNGEQSTITMDVPMIIVEDRTLVPIRFMSNALGMQVGWDGDTQTVVIMDYDDYFADFDKLAPNLNKLSSLKSEKFNSSTISYVYSVESITDDNNKYVMFSVNGDTVTANGATGIIGSVSVDTPIITSGDAEMTGIFKDGMLYMKSDLVGLMAENGGGDNVKSAASEIAGSGWCSVDLNRLFEKYGVTTKLASAANSAVTSSNKVSAKELLRNSVTTDGDAVFSEVINLAQAFDLFEQLDKYIEIDENEEGAYSVNVIVTPEDYMNAINEIYELNLTEEEKDILIGMVASDIQIMVDNDGESQQSDVYIGLSSTDENDVTNQITMTGSASAEMITNASVGDIPAQSYDITDILIGLLP